LLLTHEAWDNTKKARVRMSDRRPLSQALVIAAIAAGAIGVLLHIGGTWQVAAILLPPFLMALYNAARPARSHWIARRLQRSASPTSAQV
jgi:hypothetical protein